MLCGIWRTGLSNYGSLGMKQGLEVVNRQFCKSGISSLNDISRRFSTNNSNASIVAHPVVAPNDDTKNAFAVVKLGGLQYKVAVNDLIVVNKLENAEVGKDYLIDNVLLVGSKNQTVVGRPLVDGALVTAFVEERTQDEKVLIFKKRRKNNGSKRLRGFRRQVDLLRITKIECPM